MARLPYSSLKKDKLRPRRAPKSRDLRPVLYGATTGFATGQALRIEPVCRKARYEDAVRKCCGLRDAGYGLKHEKD